MKKITLLLVAVFFTAYGFSQNVIQNHDFEAALETFSVIEGDFSVVMRVAAHQDAQTQTANPATTATPVVDGMWVRKSPNSGYIKGVLRTDLTQPGGGTTTNTVLNLRHNQNNAATGLTNWYQNVLQQRVAGGVDLEETYYLSFDAKVDDETSPTLENIATELVAVIRDLDKNIQTTQTIQLSEGTSWNNYTASFNLPAWVAGGGAGAVGTNVIFGIGLATDYNEEAKTKYASVLLDNIVLSKGKLTTAISNLKPLVDYTIQNGIVKLMNLKNNEMVTVYSLTGSVIVKKNAQSSIMSLPLSQGIYVVKVDDRVSKVIVR